jgi:hypothetical protein
MDALGDGSMRLPENLSQMEEAVALRRHALTAALSTVRRVTPLMFPDDAAIDAWVARAVVAEREARITDKIAYKVSAEDRGTLETIIRLADSCEKGDDGSRWPGVILSVANSVYDQAFGPLLSIECPLCECHFGQDGQDGIGIAEHLRSHQRGKPTCGCAA